MKHPECGRDKETGYTASQSENTGEIMTTGPAARHNIQCCTDKYNRLHLATKSPVLRLTNI